MEHVWGYRSAGVRSIHALASYKPGSRIFRHVMEYLSTVTKRRVNIFPHVREYLSTTTAVHHATCVPITFHRLIPRKRGAHTFTQRPVRVLIPGLHENDICCRKIFPHVLKDITRRATKTLRKPSILSGWRWTGCGVECGTCVMGAN